MRILVFVPPPFREFCGNQIRRATWLGSFEETNPTVARQHRTSLLVETSPVSPLNLPFQEIGTLFESG